MDILKELVAREQRWEVFIDKIVVRMDEFCQSALPELVQVYQADTDEYKREYGRLLASVKGQMTRLKRKVDNVNDEQLQKLIDKGHKTYPMLSKERDDVSDIADKLSDKLEIFEDKWDKWMSKLEKTTVGENNHLEQKYQHILKEYDKIKGAFQCKQCGSPISIDKIFFTAAYIQCPACQTQNTFEPSTQAKDLVLLAPELAESRVKSLLDEHEKLNEACDKLEEQIRQLDLEKSTDVNGNDINKDQRISLKMQLSEYYRDTDNLAKIYLRAKCDELNKIIPELKEQHEAKYKIELKKFDVKKDEK